MARAWLLYKYEAGGDYAYLSKIPLVALAASTL